MGRDERDKVDLRVRISFVLSLRLGLGLVFGGISCDYNRVDMRLSLCFVIGDSLVWSTNAGNDGRKLKYLGRSANTCRGPWYGLGGEFATDGSDGDVDGLGGEICLRLCGDFRLGFVHLIYG
jgi:hypothetical protein